MVTWVLNGIQFLMKTPTSIVVDRQAELNSLCTTFGVEKLDLFGSATSGAFDVDRSDLDFLVTFTTCTPEDHARRYFGLASALEDLFGRTVDLVEEHAITNPYFRNGVDATRTNLYAA